MPNITLYSSMMCGYCTRARMLLDKKGVDYVDIQVDRDPEQRAIMMQRSGRSSVPQIFVGDRHIGGFDDMAELDMDGELDELLGLTDA